MRTAKTLGTILPLALLLAACGSGMTPAEKAKADADDIAFVESKQKEHAPAQPIVLQPIPPAEQAILPAEAKGCRFVLQESPGGDPVALFGTVTGHIRVDGHVLTLAPDTGTSKLPGGVWGKYVGKTHLVKLTANAQGVAWVEVLDPYDRKIYFAPGRLICASVPEA